MHLIRFLWAILLLSGPLAAQSRSDLLLKDGWQFTFADPEAATTLPENNSWTAVSIPHTWNNHDIQSGEQVHYGTAWYRRKIEIDEGMKDTRYFLRFDGVGQYAELYINGKFVGKHLGAYAAFVFEITSFLKADSSNVLQVKVNNELANAYPKDNFLFGIYGGIYRDVHLIATGDQHFSLSNFGSPGIFIHQDSVGPMFAQLRILSDIVNQDHAQKTLTLRHTLYDANQKPVAEVAEKLLAYPGGSKPVEMHLSISNPHLWNGRRDPYLYTLVTELLDEGRVLDQISQKTGLRTFSIDPEKGFSLNGAPYPLHGVCRHQEWQDMGNALGPEQHRIDMALIYEIGATSIRLAHYQQAELMYALADSLGILVWAEIPFVNGYQENADDNAQQQLAELVLQNFNHPSIFVWGLHNEVIKGDVVQQPIILTTRLQALAKVLDPSRYTVAVSNIWWKYDHPIHELADLQGFNQYTGWYGGKPAELENWIKNYHAARPDVRFSISEYGAGANIAQQSCDYTTPPDPSGQFFPEGYQTYYHETTYSAIEKYPFIWASYVWNMFDFSVPEWNRGGIKGRNHKGLVSYDRQTKKDAFYWYMANWSEEPVLYLCGRRNEQVVENSCQVLNAYCNFGTPELFVNGVSYGPMQQGINGVQFVSTELPFVSGANRIEVKANYLGASLSDSFLLFVQKQ